MKTNKDKSVIILIIPAAIGAAASIASMATARKRKKKDQGMQIEGNKEMAEFNRKQQMKLWEDTNYSAQMAQMKKAGLNPGLMYDAGGQGGVTQAQAGNVDAPKGQEEETGLEAVGMGIQAALAKAQAKNLEANTKKAEAEAKNIAGIDTEIKGEELRGKAFFNDLNDRLKEVEANARHSQAESRYWEGMRDSEKYRTDYSEKYTQNAPENTKGARMIRVEMEQMEQDLIRAKKANNILDAETIIKEFEAGLAEKGIPPNSPWYAKLLGDLLNKIGIMDWLEVGKAATKKAIKPK